MSNRTFDGLQLYLDTLNAEKNRPYFCSSRSADNMHGSDRSWRMGRHVTTRDFRTNPATPGRAHGLSSARTPPLPVLFVHRNKVVNNAGTSFAGGRAVHVIVCPFGGLPPFRKLAKVLATQGRCSCG
jgi:hypothetical protein